MAIWLEVTTLYRAQCAGMKPVFAAILAAVFVITGIALPAVAAGPAAPVESLDFGGQHYSRLTDWARANNFIVRWLQRDEMVQLTNSTWQILMEKDSLNAQFNGVEVLLAFPLVVKNGMAYLSDTDARVTFPPLFSPPTYAPGAKIRTIVLDPGHGGKDPGFQVGGNQEKKYTLLLADELKDQLKKAGFNVYLTRTRDTAVDLPQRPDFARQKGADLFISLHWNSASTGASEVKGVQTYCLTPAGASSSNSGGEIGDTRPQPGNRNNDRNLYLAYQVQKSLTRELGAEDRGVRRARFMVLTQAQMPAILIEGGYMSNPAESKKIYDSNYRRMMARAILDGVLAYKRQVEVAAPAPAPPPTAPSKPKARRIGATASSEIPGAPKSN